MLWSPAAIHSCGKRRSQAFSLVELMVVVAIMALMLCVLLPALSSVREQSRAAVCGTQLRQIGLASSAYSTSHGGWLVGSPNTSGNGARPGFSAGDYTATARSDHYPALHVFDWANPLLPLMGNRPPQDAKARYSGVVSGALGCPSNRRQAGPVNAAPLKYVLPADALAPSYATSRYFMYVGDGAKTGTVAGTLWWSDDCVPTSYLPKVDRIGRPQNKAFLADAHVVSNTKGEISNANWGFVSHGAWRRHYEGPATYTGSYLRAEMWRHWGRINILTFDGHVDRSLEGSADASNGYGSGARRAALWFPKGTRTVSLSSSMACERVVDTIP